MLDRPDLSVRAGPERLSLVSRRITRPASLGLPGTADGPAAVAPTPLARTRRRLPLTLTFHLARPFAAPVVPLGARRPIVPAPAASLAFVPVSPIPSLPVAQIGSV